MNQIALAEYQSCLLLQEQHLHNHSAGVFLPDSDRKWTAEKDPLITLAIPNQDQPIEQPTSRVEIAGVARPLELQALLE